MDDKPISTDDLYGPSSDADKATEAPPLTYEETPEIEPVVSSQEETPFISSGQPVYPSHPPISGKHKGSPITVIGGLLFFGGMFALGLWLSGYLRQYLPGGQSQSTGTPETISQARPTPYPAEATDSSSFTAWKTYSVVSGITKQPFGGVSFQLPADVLPPICDGASCASQGTYLPGGTRFTVAPRGSGEVLKDFRGTTISDARGTAFMTKPVTVGGRAATEFSGSFAGSTASGYAFSRMRGVMIPITQTTSLEVNHFTPSGITGDFAGDDALFDEILKTFSFPSAAGEKGATPSGY